MVQQACLKNDFDPGVTCGFHHPGQVIENIAFLAGPETADRKHRVDLPRTAIHRPAGLEGLGFAVHRPQRKSRHRRNPNLRALQCLRRNRDP